MEIKKATINRQETKTSLVLEGNTDSFEIILTEDNPNNIKSVFNHLIKDLKRGNFNFQLEDTKEDMYHHICIEYINQLNSEINLIYSELVEFDLIEEFEPQQD